ncbi:MAG: radical SAM/SPASM domain-containing protein [Elusimicrobia bacterium CG_4_9_14_3_um_filter_62_55]|nr:MAG: radical SAM/SPASM domain-containing protein [Elusimicrobia bacterium CG22_combo_CG10-13_8_21_14_all_63_91]PJA13464.1 MAG: radical SAM/SPASM domain-containing protein [Elusimicrobia bacterium CG_4_10_14_0_2_um_filter_63_34]PJB25350.1 MAG: radical SAM/SPASM domain-containing protein [Elusimicrobia bacterium CG_4_9_14_3_um_filter_62_55]
MSGHPTGIPGVHPKGIGRPKIDSVDYNKCPLLVIWEITRSCGLACSHCRAAAQLGRDPRELTTDEGKTLLDDIAGMGTPICILSGGDPFNRPDLEDLIAYGKRIGLRMGTIPAATENLTDERLASIKRAGCDQVAFSVDAPVAGPHDHFRGVPGAFEKTVKGIEGAHKAGIPVQINTCFAEWNLPYLEDMIAFVKEKNIVFWEVFFLIPTGRGANMKGISAKDFERVFARLEEVRKESGFHVKLTEAQQLYRFQSLADGEMKKSPAVNAGKGFAFVDFQGDAYPSGFLPVSAGNVQKRPMSEIYREASLFKDLRDPEKLQGKCGRCEYNWICGGSRARAFAMTGSPFGPDPSCSYVPKGNTVA